MYQRLSAIMFPIVAVLLVGTAVWGYQEHQEKNSILIKAENQYQRAFHNLAQHLDKLHTELGTALAVHSDSSDFQRRSLVNVWRMTNSAQNEISQLPLSLLPFHKTEKFLANIANFTYHVAIRDMSKQPITNQEMETLKTLYNRSKEIATDIREVQSKVISHNLRWMDVEIAMASENEVSDNAIVDGFKLVDKRVTEYSEVDFGPSAPDIFATKDFKQLSGKAVTPDEIKKKAIDFFQVQDERRVKVVENGQGTEYNSYSVIVSGDGGERTQQADYTKRGGKLIWFNDSRPIKAKNLNIAQAHKHAQQFLQHHGYGMMEAVAYDEYDHVANLTMARKIEDVLIYPDKLSIRVAMDNGQILGMQANDLLYSEQNRQIPKPKLSADEARNKLNGEFKVTDQSLALIENDMRKEVLCYEFQGRINGGEYRIFINAENGVEEKVELLRHDQKA